MTSLARPLQRLAVIAGCLGITAASLSGCGGGGGGNSSGNGGGGQSGTNTMFGSGFGGRAVCAANTSQSGRANWTILVYMNGANNLQPDSLLNVGQMASVGSNSNVNIVLQWKQASQASGCSDCEPNGTGTVSFNGTRRYYVHKHSAADVQAIEAGNTSSMDAMDRLPDPATNDSTGQSDMGNYLTLADFVKWGTTTYPANNLMIVLWDHGSGWLSGPDLGRAAAKKGARRAVSFDDQTNNQIETWQTPLALSASVQPIDVVAIDCSLEQMMEVAYQLKNSAKIVVGSEESPPGAGYPYDKIIADIENGAANPCVASDIVVNEFVNAYPQYTDITQSAIDLTKMQTAGAAINSFAGSLITHINDQGSVIAQARNQARSFDLAAGYFNYDIVDFAQQIINLSSKSDLTTAAYNAQVAIAGTNNTNSAVMEHKYGQSTPVGSHGLAIWLPSPGNNYPDYVNLQFYKDYPNWYNFLNDQSQ